MTARAKVMLVRPTRPNSTSEFIAARRNQDQRGVGGSPSIEGSPPPTLPVNPDVVGIESILGLAGKLSAADQKTLLAHLALKAQAKPKDAEHDRDLEMWAQAVYSELGAVIGHGDGGMPGVAVIKRLLAGSASWASVLDFMKHAKLDSLQVSERQSLYHLLAKMVVKHARSISHRSGAPLSPRLVANCSANVASLFDQAFPGYVASGLALIVARRLVASNH